METLWQDMKYGARMLAKSKGFTAVAVLTLALGIGANSAIFSVVNGVLLRPLPYKQADRLVFLSEWSQQVPYMSISMANFNDWRQMNTVFENMAAFNSENVILTGLGEPERLRMRQVTASFFPTLGLQPILGRTFTVDEDKVGADRVVLLGEGFWTRRFARDPNVLGKSLTLNGETYTVIGVLPAAGLHSSQRQYDLFSSLWRLEDRLGGQTNRGSHPGIYAYARLKPGVTVAQAQSQMKDIALRLAQQYPQTNTGNTVFVQGLLPAIVEDVQPAMIVLMIAVGLVLLIACANVANLLLARAAERQKEVAVRAALGAGRWRLVRQLLTESMLLALSGGALGLLLAVWGTDALVSAAPANVPRMEGVALDGRVLAFTFVLSLLTGIFFGIFPALQAARTDLHETLKEGGRSGMVGTGHRRLRNGLVVAEVAVSLVLLVCAGLMMKSLYNVLNADPGFDSNGVLVANVSLPDSKYDTPEKIRQFQQQMLEKVKAIPGVEYAGATLPLLGSWQTGFVIEGRPLPKPGELKSTDIARVSADYFRAVGTRLVRGRYFTEQDNENAPRVCIIDETMADSYWPGEDAIGKRLAFGNGRPQQGQTVTWMTVVGIVAHTKNYGVDQPSRVETYIPYQQDPRDSTTLVLRTGQDPASLTSAVRAAVLSVDPDIPIFNARPLESLVADQVGPRRLSVLLLGAFAGLALLLAAVGIYGVMSYSVTQRSHEIGIRMALGAQSADVFRLVLGNGLLLMSLGVALGLTGAFLASRFLRALLFQVAAHDVATFASIPLVLVAVGLFACWMPARRATRVDPMITLRYE